MIGPVTGPRFRPRPKIRIRIILFIFTLVHVVVLVPTAAAVGFLLVLLPQTNNLWLLSAN